METPRRWASTIWAWWWAFYLDDNYTAHGFLRAPDGRFTTFADPAGGNGAMQGTWAYSMNDFGVVVGATTYADNSSVGFVRSASGRIEEYEFPLVTYYNTQWINDLGEISGAYSRVYANSEEFDFAGYVRMPDGKMTTFVAPGSGTTTDYEWSGTWTSTPNIFGATTGYIYDDQAEAHAFVREPGGKITMFSQASQAAVPGAYAGTFGQAINAAGVIAGFWNDSNLVQHGLLRMPK